MSLLKLSFVSPRAMSATHGIPADIVAIVQGIIDGANSGELPVNTANTDIFEILVQHNLASVKDDVHTDTICVHNSNRGTLGLNPHDVHKNLLGIDTIGVDPLHLNGCSVFELSQGEPKRSQQIAFNMKLIEASQGLLANLTGKEDSASVGSSHFVAGCRAVNHKCRTPHPEIAHEGFLLPDRFRKKDKRMAKVLDKGMSGVRHYKSVCETVWPDLPGLVQRALNSSHNVTSLSTEPQVMCNIAELDQTRSSATSFEQMLEAMRMSNPPCAGYMNTIGKLAVEIGGGPGVPLVKFLHRFGASFGVNKSLGEEFLKALADLSVPGGMDSIAYVKIGFMATNLSCDVSRVKDGFARLLVPSDVEKLKSTLGKKKLISLNPEMREAWEVCAMLLQQGNLDEQQFDMLVGKCFVRHILILCSKDGQGKETKAYESHENVRLALIRSIVRETSEDVNLGAWDVHKDAMTNDVANDAEGSATKRPKLQGHDGLKSIDEQLSPTVVLKNKGFENGSLVKEQGVSNDVFVISHIVGSTVIMKRCTLFSEDGALYQIECKTLMDNWALHRGNLPSLLQYAPPPALEDKQFQNDELRYIAFSALRDAHTQRESTDLHYAFAPSGVLAKSDVSKSRLKLMPLTSMDHLQIMKPDDKKVGLYMMVGTQKVLITQLPKPSEKTPAGEMQKYVFVPFFWVDSTNDTAKVNMTMQTITVKHHDKTVVMPMLVNSVALTKHTRLYKYVEKKEKVAMSGVSEIKMEEEPEINMPGQESEEEKLPDGKKAEPPTRKGVKGKAGKKGKGKTKSTDAD